MLSATRLTLLALFAIALVTVFATPLAIPDEHEVNSPSAGFKGRFRVQPPADLDTNIYQLLEDGTEKVIYNSTASSTDEPVAFDIDCDTTWASPMYWNIYEAARRLEVGGRQWCVQNNPMGSRCTTWMSEKDASLAVCGVLYTRVTCDYLAWSARQIVVWCNWNDHAGGKYIWNSELKGIVY